MGNEAVFHDDLHRLLPAIPDEGIVSRSIPAGAGLGATLFGFAPGQQLTEHTATRPAVLHFLRGRARLILGGAEHQATAGSWAYLPSNLAHSIVAEDEVVMLLLLLE